MDVTEFYVDHKHALSVGDVHVWAVRLNLDQNSTAKLARILNEEEQARAAQLLFDRDRVRFTQTHGVVREILASYCDADAAGLAFARNRHGKPYLISRAKDPDLRFSVSHSGDYCLLALRRERDIGVDVEQVRDLPESITIASSYFTRAESEALAVLQGVAQRDTFFVWWAHKEALVKARGLSLATHLDRAEFALDPSGALRLCAWDGDPTVASKWFIHRLDPAPGYVAVVAGEHPVRSLTFQTWDYNRSE